MEKTQHPTTIIWENDSKTFSQQIWMGILMSAIMFGISLAFFYLFIYISQAKTELDYIKSAPGVSCSLQDDLLGESTMDTMAYLEYKEFESNYPDGITNILYDENKTMSDRLPKGGYLACFC